MTGSLPEQLDREMERAFSLAAEELRMGGHPLTAAALTLARDNVLRWREVMLRRLEALHVVRMDPEQQHALMAMVAAQMVKEAIADAHRRDAERSTAFWQNRAVKVAFVTSSLSLIAIGIERFASALRALFG